MAFDMLSKSFRTNVWDIGGNYLGFMENKLDCNGEFEKLSLKHKI